MAFFYGLLLTCHRRENYYKPVANILIAIRKLLEVFDDIVIILPLHLNPNIRQSIKIGLPDNIYNEIIREKNITDQNYIHFLINHHFLSFSFAKIKNCM